MDCWGRSRGAPRRRTRAWARLGASSEAEETISRARIVSREGGRRGRRGQRHGRARGERDRGVSAGRAERRGREADGNETRRGGRTHVLVEAPTGAREVRLRLGAEVQELRGRARGRRGRRRLLPARAGAGGGAARGGLALAHRRLRGRSASVLPRRVVPRHPFIPRSIDRNAGRFRRARTARRGVPGEGRARRDALANSPHARLRALRGVLLLSTRPITRVRYSRKARPC